MLRRWNLNEQRIVLNTFQNELLLDVWAKLHEAGGQLGGAVMKLEAVISSLIPHLKYGVHDCSGIGAPCRNVAQGIAEVSCNLIGYTVCLIRVLHHPAIPGFV